MRLKGRVTPMRRSEATVKMSEHTPGPWGEAGIGLQHTTFTLDRAFGETEDGLKGELCNVDNWCREGGRCVYEEREGTDRRWSPFQSFPVSPPTKVNRIEKEILSPVLDNAGHHLLLLVSFIIKVDKSSFSLESHHPPTKPMSHESQKLKKRGGLKKSSKLNLIVKLNELLLKQSWKP